MATYNKFHQFSEDIAKGVHDFTSVTTAELIVALTNQSNAPVATNSVLADLTEISYSGLSSRSISYVSSSQSSGVYKLILSDLTLTSSGSVGPFRYVVVYNNTPTSPSKPLICWYDYGSEITLGNGESLLIDFDNTNGLFTLS